MFEKERWHLAFLCKGVPIFTQLVHASLYHHPMAHSAHGHTKPMWGHHCQMPGNSNVFPIIDMSPSKHANYVLDLLCHSRIMLPDEARHRCLAGEGQDTQEARAGDLSASCKYYVCIVHKKCHPIAIYRPNNQTIKNVLERWTTRNIKGSGRAYVPVTMIGPGPKGVLTSPHQRAHR